jgi:isopentenyl-diphosphate Delta-isomerase
MIEYLDIVDEDDEVIGRDTRKNVHANHQIHRGIHVFVLNIKGEILLQRRSDTKDYYPGFYDSSVGAQVISGETYEECALRETMEELGFKPNDLAIICDYNSYSSRQKEKRRLFITYSKGNFKIDPKEVESVKWYSPEEIKKEIDKGIMKFTEGFKSSFQYYINAKNKNLNFKHIKSKET